MVRLFRGVAFFFVLILVLWLQTSFLTYLGVPAKAITWFGIFFVGTNICSFVFGGAGR